MDNYTNDSQQIDRPKVAPAARQRVAKTKKPVSKIIFIVVAIIVAVIGIIIVFRSFAGTVPNVGAVNNWHTVAGGTRLSVNMTPIKGESGYHFYSLTSLFKDQSYGLYSGIQTNGNLGDGREVGNLFVFSVWNATSARPENGATATPFGGEGVGYSLRLKYDWKVGSTYKIEVNRVGQDANSKGWIWAAKITDLATAKTISIGQITGTPQSALLSGGSAFHERYVGFAPVCSQTLSNLEQAGVKFDNLSSDVAASFTGTSAKNNVFTSSECAPYIQVNNSKTQAITGFGINSSEFSSIVNNYQQSSGTAAVPVYRHYSPSRGAHFFTTNKAESDKIRTQGWDYEGIAWNVLKDPNSKPVYRHYNPSIGRHFFTTNKAESDKIRTQGWRFEGIAWYAAPGQTSIPIYRHYSPTRGAHFYTKNKAESDKIRTQGWNFEGIEYYAF